jgi:hypothetical protein
MSYERETYIYLQEQDSASALLGKVIAAYKNLKELSAVTLHDLDVLTKKDFRGHDFEQAMTDLMRKVKPHPADLGIYSNNIDGIYIVKALEILGKARTLFDGETQIIDEPMILLHRKGDPDWKVFLEVESALSTDIEIDDYQRISNVENWTTAEFLTSDSPILRKAGKILQAKALTSFRTTEIRRTIENLISDSSNSLDSSSQPLRDI